MFCHETWIIAALRILAIISTRARRFSRKIKKTRTDVGETQKKLGFFIFLVLSSFFFASWSFFFVFLFFSFCRHFLREKNVKLFGLALQKALKSMKDGNLTNILNFQIAQFVSMMMIFKVVMLHRIHQQQYQKRHQYNNNNAVVVAPTTKY